MDQTNPVKTFIGWISETAGYAAVVLSFILAITGKVPGRYPVTTGTVTLLILAILLFCYRWPAVTRQAQKTLGMEIYRPARMKEKKISFWDRLLDPFRKNSARSYILPIFRRRFEAACLVLIALISIIWSESHIMAVLDELGMVWCYQNASAKYTIVVLDIATVGDDQYLFRNRLIDSLKDHAGKNIQICSSRQSVTQSDTATELGKQARASIVVWGRRDKDLIDVQIKVVSSKRMDENMVVLDRFQATDPDLVAFLANELVSRLIYQNNGDLNEAQHILRLAIDETTRNPKFEKWPPGDKKEIAKGYFLLGLIGQKVADRGQTDYELAVSDYTMALRYDSGLDRARLNRGRLYKIMKNIEKAREDFTILIDHQSNLSAAGLIERAVLEGSCWKVDYEDLARAIELDPPTGYTARGTIRLLCKDTAAAIQDLKKAIALTPENELQYKLLGEAQLANSDCGQAKQTFLDLAPQLNQNSKQEVIEELIDFPDVSPKCKQTLVEIIAALKNAPIQ